MIVKFYNNNEGIENWTIIECNNVAISQRITSNDEKYCTVVTYSDFTDTDGVERSVGDWLVFKSCYIYNNYGILINRITSGEIKDGK